MYVHLARGCQRDSISVVFWRCDDGKGLPAQQCEARANNIIIDKRLEKSGYKLYRTIFIIIIIIITHTVQALKLMAVDVIITELEKEAED